MNSSNSPRNRRRARFCFPQYSLRTLMIFVFGIAILLGILTKNVNEARHQAHVVAWVKEQGGSAFYEYDYYDKTTGNLRLGDFGWEPEILRDLLGIDFFYHVNIVDLSNSQVRDIALVASLSNLESLDLHNSPISSLSQLSSLTDLRLLDLQNTNVTEKEVVKLSDTLPQCLIYHECMVQKSAVPPKKSIRDNGQGEENTKKQNTPGE